MNILFSGSMTALITPFKDQKIDETAYRQHIDWQIENRTSVLVPCGTTGESATLSHAEHQRLIEITIEQVAGRAKVLAGTGSNATLEAIRLTEQAKAAGADGALLINPYYNKPTQQGLLAHFKAIVHAVPDFPLVLYNIPGRTGIHMTVETTAELAKIDTIVGIKDASGSLAHATEVIGAAPASFSFYSGEDILNWPLYAVGARGAISVTANLFPRLCADLWEANIDQDFERARALHYKLLKINQVLFIETNPAPIKAALSILGRCSDELRLPLVKLIPENKRKLEMVLREMEEVF